MIKSDFYKKRDDGIKLYKTYSDEDFQIQQVETGIIYDLAIDIETAKFTYVETDQKIIKEDEIKEDE